MSSPIRTIWRSDRSGARDRSQCRKWDLIGRLARRPSKRRKTAPFLKLRPGSWVASAPGSPPHLDSGSGARHGPVLALVDAHDAKKLAFRVRHDHEIPTLTWSPLNRRPELEQSLDLRLLIADLLLEGYAARFRAGYPAAIVPLRAALSRLRGGSRRAAIHNAPQGCSYTAVTWSKSQPTCRPRWGKPGWVVSGAANCETPLHYSLLIIPV